MTVTQPFGTSVIANIFSMYFASFLHIFDMRILNLQIAHLLEEDFIEPYTDDIRELAGHVNLLAKIVKNDNTKGLGLHLYDQHLKQ